MTPPSRAGDRGSLTLELAVVAPGLLLLLALLVVGGRLAIAEASVEAAARDAARTASIARTAPAAQSQATATVETALAAQGLRCASTSVTVDTAQFAVPVGQPAQVSVLVNCQVTLADLPLPGLPGSSTVSATVHSPLDTYRER